MLSKTTPNVSFNNIRYEYRACIEFESNEIILESDIGERLTWDYTAENLALVNAAIPEIMARVSFS